VIPLYVYDGLLVPPSYRFDALLTWKPKNANGNGTSRWHSVLKLCRKHASLTVDKAGTLQFASIVAKVELLDFIMRFGAVFLAALALIFPIATSQSVDHHRHASKRYIVKLKPGVNISSICEETNPKIIHKYTFINSFAATFDENELDDLRNNPGVAYIAGDTLMNLAAIETQHDASWGLARLSTRAGLADQNPNHANFTFTHHSSAGVGVDIYCLDTGILREHEEFGGRASYGPSFDSSPLDDNGHGTHVAGIAAGSRFGVAKRANIISVKVANGQFAFATDL
ncbi:hypothetical protein H0H93_006040, partial [Arthromyces matolae]